MSIFSIFSIFVEPQSNMNATQHSALATDKSDKIEQPEEGGSEPEVTEGTINATGEETTKKKRHRKKKKAASAALAAAPESDLLTTHIQSSLAGASQTVDKLADGLASTSLPKTNNKLEDNKEEGDDEEDEKPGAEGWPLFE